MAVHTPELKRITGEVIGGVASSMLMNRIYATLEQAPDPKTAATKVEKLVALFLGHDHARTLGDRFRVITG